MCARPVSHAGAQNHRDAEAHAILEQFRRRGSTLDKSIKSGLLFNAIARDGRDGALFNSIAELLSIVVLQFWLIKCLKT